MIVMMSGGRKTPVPDDGYGETHPFNSRCSLENPLQDNDLCERNQAPFLHEDNLSFFLSWKLFRGSGTQVGQIFSVITATPH